MSKVYGILTEKVTGMIAAGTVPWKRPWRTGGVRPMNVRGTTYNGINYVMLRLIADMNGWSNVWLSFNQIKQLGGTIKAGEEKKHNMAYLYKFIEKTDANGTESTFPIFRFFLVWNMSQVDNIEMPKWAKNDENQFAEMPAPQSIVDGYSDKPEIRHNGDKACYIPVIDKINMPKPESFDSPEHYYATLFHELSHSTGHSSRLNRKEIMDPITFRSHSYSLEELVAELSSLFLSDACGISSNIIENSAAYLANWHDALSRDPKMFATAAARAQKSANYILGSAPETFEDKE